MICLRSKLAVLIKEERGKSSNKKLTHSSPYLQEIEKTCPGTSL